MEQHDPRRIALKARELLLQHGRKAEDIAYALMQEEMQHDDVIEAGFWLAVIQEIRVLETTSGAMN